MDGWANGPDRMGRVTRALHWTMAALILGQIGLGLTLPRLAPSLSNLWLYGLHKSLGMTLLVLALVRLAWHRISPPPAPLGDAAKARTRLARTVHGAIYAALVIVPLAGWVGASASGIDTVVWGVWTLPAIAPMTEAWQDRGLAVHAWATRALMALLALHLAGVLGRVRSGDGTLRRMWTGTPHPRP